MDENKETVRSKEISRLVDPKIIRTNPFGENKSGDRAYRRAERIGAALYLLTNHVPSEEPARLRLRNGAAQLLNNILDLRSEMRSTSSLKIVQAEVSIRELISMVRMLSIAGFISLANAEVMVEALDELGIFLTQSQKSLLSEKVRITREELLDVRNSTMSIIKDIKDKEIQKDKEGIKDIPENQSSPEQVSPTIEVRFEAILEILRSGGSMGIRDISLNIPEYSEKMIQRALVDLVQKGVVKKIGEKRWSRYSLVQ